MSDRLPLTLSPELMGNAPDDIICSHSHFVELMTMFCEMTGSDVRGVVIQILGGG